MADNKQHDTRTARRPDCVTEIRMGNSVLVVSGYFKKDTTTTAADKMARVLEAEAAATQNPPFPTARPTIPWFHCTTEQGWLYSGKSVKSASLQLVKSPVFV